MIQGTLLVGFVTSNQLLNNTLITKQLRAGDVSVFPQGLIHFQLNNGTGDAVFIAMFDAQSPGVVTPTFAMFSTKPAMPMEVLTKTFLMGEDEVTAMKSKFIGF